MALLGKIDSFNLKPDDICEYLERVEQYFFGNDIEDAKKKTAIFLTVIGTDTYSLLRSLVAPETPSSKSVETLFEILKEHLKPQLITIAERYKFYCRDQHENESISNYVAELRKLTLNCNFREFLDEVLQDRIVCGLISNSTRRRLLAERTLTLKTAINFAKTLESAEVETQLINPEIIKNEKAFVIKPKIRKCYRCNSVEYLANKCPFKDLVCNTCKIKGHLSKTCRNSIKKDFRLNKKPSKNFNLEENEDTPSDDENSVYYVNKMHHVNPLKVDMKVNNQFIKFEVDTGSGITLISESTYQKNLSNYQLSKTNITIKTYANESLNVLGKIKVVVQYKESVFTNFPLYIVSGNGVNLLGRTWLSEIKLDWTSLLNDHKEQVNNVNKSESISGQLEHLVKNYSEIFLDNLGLMKGFKVKINVEPNASPKFVTARTVPLR